MPEEMANALQVMADEAGESLNAYLVLVLDDYLQKMHEKRLELVVPEKKLQKES
jgi:hypothetical protein